MPAEGEKDNFATTVCGVVGWFEFLFSGGGVTVAQFSLHSTIDMICIPVDPKYAMQKGGTPVTVRC